MCVRTQGQRASSGCRPEREPASDCFLAFWLLVGRLSLLASEGCVLGVSWREGVVYGGWSTGFSFSQCRRRAAAGCCRCCLLCCAVFRCCTLVLTAPTGPSLACLVPQAAGIESGDILYKLDGVPLGSYKDGLSLFKNKTGPVVITCIRQDDVTI